MAKKQSLGTTKRFGTRYGRSNKLAVARIEAQYRTTQKCPYCLYTTAKRLSRGIWGCSKCGSKFTAKAYSIHLTKKSEGATEVEDNLDELFAPTSVEEEA